MIINLITFSKVDFVRQPRIFNLYASRQLMTWAERKVSLSDQLGHELRNFGITDVFRMILEKFLRAQGRVVITAFNLF